MKLNKKGIAPFVIVGIIGVVVVMFILLIALVVGQGFVMPGGEGGDKQKVVCDVTVKEHLLSSEPTIETYNCHVEGSCIFSLSAQPLGFFTSRGYVRLRFGTNIDKKSYDVSRLGIGSEKLTLKVCTPQTSGSLVLFDEDNNALETKQVEV